MTSSVEIENIVKAYGEELTPPNGDISLGALTAMIEYLNCQLPFFRKKVRFEREVFNDEEEYWVPFLKSLIFNIECASLKFKNFSLSELGFAFFEFKRPIEEIISLPLNSHAERKTAIQLACCKETYDPKLLSRILNHKDTSIKTIKLGLKEAMDTKNIHALRYMIQDLFDSCGGEYEESDDEEEEEWSDNEETEDKKNKKKEFDKSREELREKTKQEVQKAAKRFVKYMDYCILYAKETFNFDVMLMIIEEEQKGNLMERAFELFLKKKSSPFVQLTKTMKYHLLLTMKNDMPIVFEAIAKQLAENEDGLVFLKKLHAYCFNFKDLYENYSEILQKLISF